MSAAAPVGIGLRQPHYDEVLAQPPPLGFVEVHSENFFADGGAALAVLQRARETYPVSLHGVGLGLGSAAGIDAWHLDRLERLVRRVDPTWVSDHASFARGRVDGAAAVHHANDLLPVAFNAASLRIMADNVGRVQDRLGRRLLVENLAAYLSYDADPRAEPEFFAELLRRSGCAMLLDLNNLMVNALNAGVADPLARARAFVDALPVAGVAEIHLAGHDDSGDLVIDDHGSRVRDSVWVLYAHALRRFGALPTLIEWDSALPPLATLLDEAALARAAMGATP